jgi:hypothetical protein
VRKERAYVFLFKGERKKYTTMKKVKKKNMKRRRQKRRKFKSYAVS